MSLSKIRRRIGGTVKDLAPDGAILVPLCFRLMAPNGAIWSRDQRTVIISNIVSSKTTWPIKTKLYMEHPQRELKFA